MSQNVKKKSAHNIYFGIDRETNELRHISEVVSGMACGCVCAACGRPLEARKGEVRQHHFAHNSNNECVYASEVAIYREIADILEHSRILALPAVISHIGGKEREEKKCELHEVQYSCKLSQYPPTLEVSASGHRLRLLVEFGRYYSEEDLEVFRREAVDGDFSVMLLQFPDIRVETFFTKENLNKYVTISAEKSCWVRSAWKDKEHPEPIAVRCPVKPERSVDRERHSFSERKRTPAMLSPLPDNSAAASVEDEAYAQEKARIKRIFDAEAPEQTIDKFGRRWVQCVCCGEVKLTEDMLDYGGRERVNKGICKKCSKEGKLS